MSPLGLISLVIIGLGSKDLLFSPDSGQKLIDGTFLFSGMFTLSFDLIAGRRTPSRSVICDWLSITGLLVSTGMMTIISCWKLIPELSPIPDLTNDLVLYFAIPVLLVFFTTTSWMAFRRFKRNVPYESGI